MFGVSCVTYAVALGHNSACHQTLHVQTGQQVGSSTNNDAL